MALSLVGAMLSVGWRTLGLGVGRGLVVVAVLAVPAAGEEVVHVVGETATRLGVDADHVAILGAVPVGVPIVELRSHSAPGWTVGRLRAAGGVHTGPATVAAGVADLTDTFVSPRLIDGEGGEVFVTRDLLVSFHPHVSDGEALALLAATGDGFRVARDYAGLSGVHRWRCRTGSGFVVLDVVAALRSRPDLVTWVEPDFLMTGRYHASSNDPLFPSSWGLHNIGQSFGVADVDVDALQAWDLSRGEGVIAVVLDGGIDPSHPDLLDAPGADFTGQNSAGAPFNSCDIHGTPVAGCIGAILNNAVGAVGVAPSAQVASARIAISATPCDGTFVAQSTWIVDGLSWAESIGAKVTNASLTLNFSSNLINTKYAATRDAGMIHFAATGNLGNAMISYPANLATVNAISAIDNSGQLANFLGGCLSWNAGSSYGSGLAFAAPGEDIQTTDRRSVDGYSPGDYVCIDGTSFAAPFAAGVAALVASVAPELGATDIESILQSTALDLGAPGYDVTFGAGLPKARAALEAAITQRTRAFELDGPPFVFADWADGDANPDPIPYTLSHGSGWSGDLAWTAAVLDGAAWVSVAPSAGTLSGEDATEALTISIDPTALEVGIHRATLRIADDANPDNAHEIPITLVVGNAAFALGDRLTGSIDTGDDVDEAAFLGVAGQKVQLKWKPTADSLKARVTVVQPDGSTLKSWTLGGKAKGIKKQVKLKSSGVHRLRIESDDGSVGPFEVLTKRKKLPADASSFKQVIATTQAGAPAELTLTALPGAQLTPSFKMKKFPVGALRFDLVTPAGRVIAMAGPPSYSSALVTLPSTALGETGTYRFRVHAMNQGDKVKVTVSLAPPSPGDADVVVD